MEKSPVVMKRCPFRTTNIVPSELGRKPVPSNWLMATDIAEERAISITPKTKYCDIY